ncbi:uncharacterized protein SCALIN_C11_0023 [Candidatus Scalindua japonica]|uniref:Uncharacterized protein n=2 Tax=Candidatus Scalindua japonica TaxID=1284222 RepID=A0A286TX05_9BACT|nr:uncharacterized protein SCALIN_C11_0023 [Candidatus Scalindua japonica]
MAGTWLAPHYYKATTKVFIHNNPKQEITLFPDIAKYAERDNRASLSQDLVQLLISDDLAREIVTLFEIDKIYYKKNYEPESLRDIVWYYIHKTIDVIKYPYTFFKSLLVYSGLSEPEPEEDYFFSALGWFTGDWLDVSAVREARVVNISIWGPSPRLASDIANKMAELLVKRTLEITRSQALEGYDFTVSQLKGTEEQYLDSLESLKRFREENNIVSIDEQKKVTILSLNKFENEAAELIAELSGVTNKASEISAKIKNENEMIISSDITGNNILVVELKSRLKDLEIALKTMLLEKTEKNIDVIKLRSQINEINSKLKKELENIVNSKTEGINPLHQSLRQQLIDLESQKQYLDAKSKVVYSTISNIKKDLILLSNKGIELETLVTSVEIYRTLYKTVKDKLEKLLVMKANEINEYGLSTITRANLPDVMSVTWPWFKINVFYVGIPLSIIAAFLACFFLDFWVDVFSTRKEIELFTGLPVIGSIPDIKNKGR